MPESLMRELQFSRWQWGLLLVRQQPYVLSLLGLKLKWMKISSFIVKLAATGILPFHIVGGDSLKYFLV